MIYLDAGNGNCSKNKLCIELLKVLKSSAKFEASFYLICTVFKLLFLGHE